jgi:hypothetical protein
LFTGRVREIGDVVAVDQTRISISAPRAAAGRPSTICVNGAGLTVRPGAQPTQPLLLGARRGQEAP